jgi:viologen exporter family transport system permease protein
VRLDWELARGGYRRYAAYPAATWAGILTNSVFGFLQAYILLALYDTREDIGGYDATDTVTYVWLTQAMIGAVAVFGWVDMSERITSGEIATDLARPVHPLRASLAFDFGRALYQTLFRGLPPLAVGAIVFDLEAPTSPVIWTAFLASIVLAIALSFAFRVLYNLSAFWLLDFRGPMLIAVTISLFLSGFVVPVRFFPGWLETFANATPFPSMVQRPVDLFVGKAEGMELVTTLAVQAAWTAALFAVAYAVFAAGTRRLVVQGG